MSKGTTLNIDPEQITQRRFERGWSQAELASVAGLDVRTIQRIEATGAASLRSKKALANALQVTIHELEQKEPDMTPCPHCRSDRVFESDKPIDTSTIGGELLPKLAPGPFSSAKMRAVVCGDCGLLRYFVDSAALQKLDSSKHWKPA